MKFVLALLGALIGGMAGGPAAALGGALSGWLFGLLLQRQKAEGGDSRLAERVELLERDVARLQTQLQRLGTFAPDEAGLPVAEPAPIAPIGVDTRPDTPLDTHPATLPATLPGPIPVFDTVPAELLPIPPRPPRPPRPAPAPALPLRDRLPPAVSRFIYGGNTIVKVGVLILFLGLAFLLRYASERVTTPPELRYAGVALIGAVLLVLGWRLRARADAPGRQGYGLILQGGGIGVFYLTALAAIKLQPLLDPGVAFAFMALVSVLGAVLAVLQNAPWLALVSMLEGLVAPVLVGGGSGSPVPLLSYLAVLDIGVFLMAWFRAWRPLNLVAFTGTSLLAGGWAQARYSEAAQAPLQAFLLFFFLLFTAIGVLFARRALALGDEPDARQPLSARAAQALRQLGRVDSTLAFGVPLAAFSLQYLLVKDEPWGPAWAAFGFALFYLLLGGALLRRAAPRYALLGEAYVIVSAIFGTLTIPLALEGSWTGATWAVEAAGMYWLGRRQQRAYARLLAQGVLTIAALRLFSALGLDERPGTPLLDGSVLGMALLFVAALAMHEVHRRWPEPHRLWRAGSRAGLALLAVAALATAAWMLVSPPWASLLSAALGLAVLWLGLRLAHPALSLAWGLLQLLAGAGLMVTASPLATWRWQPGTIGFGLWGALALAMAALLAGDALQRSSARWAQHPALQWGLVGWLLLWWLQVIPPELHARLSHSQHLALWPALATGWVLLSSVLFTALARWRHWRTLGQATAVTLPALTVMALLGPLSADQTPSSHLGWLVWPLALLWHGLLLRAQPAWLAPAVLRALHVLGVWLFVLLAGRECQLAMAGLGDPGSAWGPLGQMLVPAAVLLALTRPALLQRWPLAAFRNSYLLVACTPLAAGLLLWLWVSNTGPGSAAPLPFVPLLNPLEIGHGLVLMALLLWQRALPASVPSAIPRTLRLGLIGLTALALYTGAVLRACHHLAGVPWQLDALMASTLAQAALSVAWAVVGVALMLLGGRRLRRSVWAVGAGLLGVVVVKLFLVELADHGGLYRIVSFIVVGLLLLLVGYFAPVPPKQAEAVEGHAA
jgi:uncharacterized membrane protein